VMMRIVDMMYAIPYMLIALQSLSIGLFGRNHGPATQAITISSKTTKPENAARLRTKRSAAVASGPRERGALAMAASGSSAAAVD
jgi:ABC-type dipeptide/oligopeptide/nickel transport system permease subunit